ncbi:hypothetical protein BCR44DRAFT_38015, partial [Catenaria anguillulae PL171]
MPSSNTAMNTPHSLLPVELQLDVFALCHPSIHLPASSRTAFAAFSEGKSRVLDAWLRRIIFLDPQYDPRIVNRGNSPAQLNHKANAQFELAGQQHSVAQIESHVAYFLKANVPAEEGWGGWAAALAPNPGDAPPVAPPVITKSLLEWLFHRKNHADRAITNEPDLVAELDRIRAEFGQPVQSSSWQVLPDALLLVSFFIRTSQIDLLHFSLDFLLSRFPFLGTTAAHFTLWSHFMLDNRIGLRSKLRDLANRTQGIPNLTMTYPTFLCLLALFDWSMSAVETISHIFTKSLNVSTVANLVLYHSQTSFLEPMMATFSQLDQPTSREPSSRVLSVINWIRVHETTAAFHPNYYSPYWSQHVFRNHRLFFDVLALHDLMPDVPPHPSKGDLSFAVARWVKKGYSQSVPLALKHDLLHENEMVELLHYGAMTGDTPLMGQLSAQCKRDGNFQRVVRRAIQYCCLSDADPPHTRTTLFGLLIADHGGDADRVPMTNLLTDHARQLSSRVYLQRVARYSLLDLLSIECQWDYTTFLQEHLCKGRHSFPFVWASDTAFWSKLIATCLSRGIAWERLSLKEVVAVCALELMSFMAAKGLDWRQNAEMRTARVTDDEAKVVSFLVQLVRSRLNESKVAAAGNINRESKKARTYVWGNRYHSFSQLLPHDCWHTLREGVIAVATLSPLPPADSVNARDPRVHTNLAHDFFLDTMLVLDAQFVYELIPFRNVVGTLRLWTRLGYHKFVRRRNQLPLVLGVLRAAAESGEADKVAYIIGGLPDSFRTSKGFVLGLRAIMRKDTRGALEVGLEASGWRRECEELLGQHELLSRQDELTVSDSDEVELTCVF